MIEWDECPGHTKKKIEIEDIKRQFEHNFESIKGYQLKKKKKERKNIDKQNPKKQFISPCPKLPKP